jgi:glycosyltransferase involved in cell wall biosynthesis
MHVAYIAGYQGPALLRQRTMQTNRALAGSQKIETLARLLARAGHEVTLLANGYCVERQGRRFPALIEELPAEPAPITVHYPPGADAPPANAWLAIAGLRRLIAEHHARRPFDLAVVYNIATVHAPAMFQFGWRLGVPLVLEYEDNALVDRAGRTSWRARHRRWLKNVLDRRIRGCFAPSPELLAQYPRCPTYLLRGIIADDLLAACAARLDPAERIAIFAGSLSESKGVDRLLEAWDAERPDGWALHVTGAGPLETQLRERAASIPNVTFHGCVERADVVRLLASAAVCLNPHRQQEAAGSVFPFKLIEYLATDARVLSTRMGEFEAELEDAITYCPDDTVEGLREGLRTVLALPPLAPSAAGAYVRATYSCAAVSRALDEFLAECLAGAPS